MLFLVLCTFSEDEQVWIEQLFNENTPFYIKFLISASIRKQTRKTAVAQAFLNIMEHFEKISQLPRRDQIPYSVIIAKNASYDILRKKKKMIPVEEFYETRTDSGVEEAFFEKFKKEQLAVALEHLEENDRTLLMFRFGRNMSLKDIAVLMGISEETAKKRSQRAIKKLKKKLEEIER